MSRGVGRLQRRILWELAQPYEPAYRFVVDIANELFPPRASRSALVSVRRALASLAKHRLVWSRLDAMRDGRGILSGLPWTRMPGDHDARPEFGAPCRCCPGGQDAFRATLDRAGARRLLDLPPDQTDVPAPTSDPPPAGVQRSKIPIDALANDLLVAMKTASRASGPGSPADYAWRHPRAITDGWIARGWATEYIRRMVDRQYEVSIYCSRGHQVAAKVLRHLEAAGLIEVGVIERGPRDRGVRPHTFLRIIDKCCLSTSADAKATHNKDDCGPEGPRNGEGGAP